MRRLSLRKRKFFPFTVFIFFVILFLIMFFYIAFSPAFTKLAEAACANHTRSLIYSAVLSLSETEDFSSLSQSKEQNGKIVSITLDSANANKIRALIATKVNSMLKDEEFSTFSIPAGNLTGIPLLSGRGFKIPLRIVPLGSVEADILSDFSEAGINQTKHSVYIKASAKVGLMSPFSSTDTFTETTIPLTETIIVGDIPNLYAGGTPKKG